MIIWVGKYDMTAPQEWQWRGTYPEPWGFYNVSTDCSVNQKFALRLGYVLNMGVTRRQVTDVSRFKLPICHLTRTLVGVDDQFFNLPISRILAQPPGIWSG